MLQVRVIPCLLLKNNGLYKGIKFKDHQYVGDPINAVKIFNDKEVDEIAFLDISATNDHRQPNFSLINDIASECFIPFSYGGGIRTLEQASKLFSMGVERVIINTSAIENSELISEIAKVYGTQSVIASIDVKRNFWGHHEIYSHSGTKNVKEDLLSYIKKMETLGAGEIMLTSIDRDGTGLGYDLKLIESVSKSVAIPLIAVGGAGNLLHLQEAFKHGASAVGAGSMFVFHGKHRAVLITYPSQADLKNLFK
jgi:imidazole glycerol-phosphate synthase subunit HisF